MGACRIRRGVSAAFAAASGADPDFYTPSSDLYKEGSDCSWSPSSLSMGYYSSPSQLLLPQLSLQTTTERHPAFPSRLQTQKQPPAVLCNGDRVSPCDAVEFQARAIIWRAEQEMERTMRGPRRRSSTASPPLSLQLLPDTVARWQLANPGTASVRKSLLWFLQRRKARIRAAGSPYGGSNYNKKLMVHTAPSAAAGAPRHYPPSSCPGSIASPRESRRRMIVGG